MDPPVKPGDDFLIGPTVGLDCAPLALHLNLFSLNSDKLGSNGMKYKKNIKKAAKKAWQGLYKLDPRKSLKRVLSVWFMLFALVPLFIIVGYATYLFNHRINDELSKRLTAFEKGIDLELIDVEEKLRLGGLRHANEYYLMNLFRWKKKSQLESVSKSLIENYIIDRMTYFSPDGRRFLTIQAKRVTDNPEIILPDEAKKLPPSLLSAIKNQRQVVVKSAFKEIGFTLDAYSVMKLGGNTIGYIKETVLIDRQYSLSTKERTGLHICLLNDNFELLSSTFTLDEESDFSYPSHKFKRRINKLNIGNESYMALTKPMRDDDEKTYGYLAILVSRSNAQQTLQGILSIFILICIVIAIIVILFTHIASNTVLSPIEKLLKATQAIKKGKLEQSVEIPKMQEIGDLVSSFNEMSKALSKANRERKKAQAQLVHSSKMVSLGQLVAGVAHELNNPIGYTYSNLNHLKDYVDDIQKILDFYDKYSKKLPEKDRKLLQKMKKELNIDFIRKDIGSIIESSLDGTQRTKDIVGGLRNFSRLDEAEIKIVDLNEGIKTTLKLLTSAFRGRIKVEKKFGKIPKISCYSSQINQVFMNILNNASHAIPKRGTIQIKIKILRIPCRVCCALDRETNMARYP